MHVARMAGFTVANRKATGLPVGNVRLLEERFDEADYDLLGELVRCLQGACASD